MKIAIDISPISSTSGHKVRGSGFYVQNLVDEYKILDKELFTFFTKNDQLPKNINLIHIPYFDPFFLNLSITSSVKRVVTVHDLIPFVYPAHFPAGMRGSLNWLIQKMILRTMSAIITDSESSKNDIHKFTGYPKEKIHVIYLAAAQHFKQIKISQAQKRHIQKKYSLPDKYALYVGDVTWNKNIPNLVNAIQHVDIPLVMVGKALASDTYDRSNVWNKDLDTVSHMIQEDSRFIKLGFVSDEDLVSLYNMATVFIMPSRYEGFGLPVVEAMSCGTPVISTQGGSLREVVGDACMIIEPENPMDMAEKIKQVFHNVKIQNELSKKSLIQAKKFSWKKTAQETIAVYNEIIS